MLLDSMLIQAMECQLNSNDVINLKYINNNIPLLEYDPSVFWTPNLYIENAIGDLKEELRYKLEVVEKSRPDPNSNSNNLTIRVCELRKVRGVFYEVFFTSKFQL
jgi:hypothetical protein